MLVHHLAGHKFPGWVRVLVKVTGSKVLSVYELKIIQTTGLDVAWSGSEHFSVHAIIVLMYRPLSRPFQYQTQGCTDLQARIPVHKAVACVKPPVRRVGFKAKNRVCTLSTLVLRGFACKCNCRVGNSAPGVQDYCKLRATVPPPRPKILFETWLLRKVPQCGGPNALFNKCVADA